MICGLLGETLKHSYSPQIHRQLGNYSYQLFEKKPEELAQFLNNDSFHGLNVTIPYKKAVIPFCKELSPEARKLGSVNTIIRRSDGSLIGHNTDYFGFRSMAARTGISFFQKKVLVLGSGGASNTVCAVMEELGARVVVISRNGRDNYNNLNRHKDCAVIVNATPVGMYPNTGMAPLDISQFPGLECVMDLIYNPARTKLLLDAEEKGIPTANGLWMLVAQAKESAQWFTGRTIGDERIESIYNQLKLQMENIVLIGMPGCGKSTIGKLLAEQLKKEFVDADASIEAAAGCSIPEIFQNQGESGFRELETQVLKDLGKRSSIVIATGGGCVTRRENLPLLRQNATIVWIKRELSLLPKDGRPLSQQNDLSQMYSVREPLYALFADYTIDNRGTPQEVASAIIKEIRK